MSSVNGLGNSAAIGALKSQLDGSKPFNPQLAMLLLSAANYDEETKKSKLLMGDALTNLQKLNAANQLKEKLAAIRSDRATAGTADTAGISTTEGQNKVKAFGTAISASGMSIDADVKKRLNDGSATKADLDAISTSLQTIQDEATNQSQMTNMYIQNSNNRQSQLISMGMSAIDLMKSMGDRVWR